MIGFEDLILATATYDKANRIVYATVNSVLVPLSKDDYVVLTVSGSSVLAQVVALETSGDRAILQITGFDIDHAWLNSLFNSGSEQVVLLKGLSKSKPQVNPYAIIDFPASVSTPAIILELKQKIASANGLNFSEAVALLGFNPSSQVGVTFNAGNPKTMVNTFFADKVKARFSNKGLGILSDRTKMGRVFTSDQPVKQELLSNYLQNMRQVLLSRDEEQFFYALSVLDNHSKVILNNKQIKNVRVFKKDGKKEYRIQFKENIEFIGLSGNYTILIEKKNVESLDGLAWYGETWPRPLYWLSLDQAFNDVTYSKKYVAAAAGLDFDLLFPGDFWTFSFIGELASFTVDNKTIYGDLILGEDNNVKFVKPANVSVLAWAKDLAALKSNGKGVLAQVKKGFLAKENTLQLKVDLGNVEDALEVFKGSQAITVADTVAVGQLIPLLRTFKVKDAENSPAKAGVNALTGITTLRSGLVKWYKEGKYVEFTVKNNSKETFNVVNSNGADAFFQEVYFINKFFEAAVADIKTNYVRELKDVLNSSDTDEQVEVTWMMTVTSGGERFQVELHNAESIPFNSGQNYRFYLPEHTLVVWQNYSSDDVVLTFNRTEFGNVVV